MLARVGAELCPARRGLQRLQDPCAGEAELQSLGCFRRVTPTEINVLKYF